MGSGEGIALGNSACVNPPNNIIFWGATGQAKVLRELVERLGYRLIALFDNNPSVQPPFSDVPLYFGEAEFQKWRKSNPNSEAVSLVAIGGSRGRTRCRIQSQLGAQGYRPIVAIHPTAFVAANARLGSGTQILAQSMVGIGASLGVACIVNSSANVDHECRLGDGVHVCPGAILAGEVMVGDYSMIGTGATILPRIRIGANVVVGSGAVVTKDVPDATVVYGNPARIVRDNPIDEE
jgi:sugar O-acyltransferase (sialic acid O-acetyltransferase NeuD family)